MHIRDKVALITGASGGIGRAIACTLARSGCHTALVDIDGAGLEETAAHVSKYGVTVSRHLLDVRDRQAVSSLPAKLVQQYGGIDILINNAGIAAVGTFLQVTEEAFDRVMDINFHAVVRMTRAFLPHLLQRKEARIINMSSVFGFISPMEQTAYSASKFAVRGFSNALRHELEGTPVGVMVVHPGGIATGIARNAIIPPGVDAADAALKIAQQEMLLRMLPEKAGAIIVRGIEQNKARVLVGADAKAISLIERMMPVRYWTVLKLLKRLLEK